MLKGSSAITSYDERSSAQRNGFPLSGKAIGKKQNNA